MRRRSFHLCRAAVLLGACLIAIGCTRGTPTRVTFSQSAQTIEFNDFVEVIASVSRPRPDNPYTDAWYRGWFETADGSKRWTVEGFCDADDGSMFRMRFTPPAPGDYRYFVEYQQREGSSRSSSGTFHASDGHRRGPIRVDARYPWHFVWEGTGEHYFFNGTTAYWLVGWTDEKVIQDSLERLHRLKINRIRVTLAGRTNISYGEPVWVGPNWTSYTTAWPAQQPEDIYHPGFDYSRFYLPHWQKFERMVRFARDRDMVISVVLDMNDSRTHPRAGSEDELRFFHYAVDRLSAFSNVTWDLGDDLNMYRDDPWTRRTGTFIKGLDPYHHLATSHPTDNRHQDRRADWFDFTSFQEWSREQHAFMLGERKKQEQIGRIIPQTNEEYGYEDHYPTWSAGLGSESADSLRRTAWDIAMAGGYGTTGETVRRGTNVLPDTGGGWINGRGDDTMKMLQGYAYLVDFFTSFEWWKAEPHDELVNKGNYCLADIGATYAAYLPHGGTISLRLGAGTFQGAWYDPSTGERTPLQQVRSSVWTATSPSTDRDWAILLQKQ